MYIADMLSRAYVKPSGVQHDNIESFQMLSDEISYINQMAYIRMSQGTARQVKMCIIRDPMLQDGQILMIKYQCVFVSIGVIKKKSLLRTEFCSKA
jgi:hypothetical protein